MTSSAMDDAVRFIDSHTARLNISRKWTREQAGDHAPQVKALWDAHLRRTNQAMERMYSSAADPADVDLHAVSAEQIRLMRAELTQDQSPAAALFREATEWLLPSLPR